MYGRFIVVRTINNVCFQAHTQTCDWQSTKHFFQPSKHLLFSTKLCLSPPVWSCLGHGRFMIQICASIKKSCWCQAQEQCCYHKTGGANHIQPLLQYLSHQTARSWKINLNKKWRERQPRYAGHGATWSRFWLNVGKPFSFWWDDWWVAKKLNVKGPSCCCVITDWRIADSSGI